MPHSSIAPWHSMTSFAQIEKEHEGTLYKIQAKSVNHRFFDLKIRAGREWQMKENEIKTWLKSKLHRGSVELWIDTSKPAKQESESGNEKLSSFLEQLDGAAAFAAKSHPTLQQSPWLPALALALNKEAWLQDEISGSPQSTLENCENLEAWFLELADKMNEARQVEGLQTQKAVEEIGKQLRANLDIVSANVEELSSAWEKNLHERIEKLSERLQQEAPENSRIYQEFVLLADKKDVSEELQRIDSHLKALEELLLRNKDKQVGKRLDFCAQELNREFTTLNNKVQNPELGKKLGESKLLIEKIREQCLNLV